MIYFNEINMLKTNYNNCLILIIKIHQMYLLSSVSWYRQHYVEIPSAVENRTYVSGIGTDQSSKSVTSRDAVYTYIQSHVRFLKFNNYLHPILTFISNDIKIRTV